MKKRAMKKWIPKGTSYCGRCKWRIVRKNTTNPETQLREHYCLYIGKGDNDLSYGLLWDGCKECGEHDTDKDYNKYLYKEAKYNYRHRNKLPEEYHLIF